MVVGIHRNTDLRCVRLHAAYDPRVPEDRKEDDLEDMHDEINSLRSAVERLTAELAWVKLTLGSLVAGGVHPDDSAERTRPPYGLMTIVLPALTAVAVAIISKL